MVRVKDIPESEQFVLYFVSLLPLRREKGHSLDRGPGLILPMRTGSIVSRARTAAIPVKNETSPKAFSFSRWSGTAFATSVFITGTT